MYLLVYTSPLKSIYDIYKMAYIQDFAVYIIDNECVSMFSVFRVGRSMEGVIA